MTDKIKVAMYSRRNREERAVIYVRGNREAAQEMFCRAYAIDKDYDVICITRDIKDANNCDVLLVTDESRIGRDKNEHDLIVNALKEKGIRIESVIDEDNAEKYIDLIITLSEQCKTKVAKTMSDRTK